MDRTLVEMYKKEVLLFLATMGITLGNTIINTDENTNQQNKAFIKGKMNQILSGNFRQTEMDMAIDELIPYLRQHDK